MTEYTIYTPTYNRAHTLPRVYDCLKNQSFQDFIWLIIDDGSNDNTRTLVDQWINESLIEIRYLYKLNGGKHSAIELANKSVTTKYIIGLDSDDILLPGALAIFKYNWDKVVEDGLEDKVAEIRAFLVRNSDDQIIGGKITMFKKGIDYIDSNWQEWVLKNKFKHEMIMAHNTAKLNESVLINKYDYNIDKIMFLSEGIFWSAIGRKYNTRYINQIVGIVYYDSEGSLLRPKVKDTRRFYNHMVASFYIVDENISYFWYNPWFFIQNILIFSISGFYTGESFRKQFKVIKSISFKLLYLILYPLTYCLYVIRNYILKLK